MRPARARFLARALLQLPRRKARRLQLQETRILPELRWSANGGDRRIARRSGATAQAVAAVGAVAALCVAVPPCDRCRGAEPRARHRVPRDLGLHSAQSEA